MRRSKLRIHLASSNRGKLREFALAAAGSGYQVEALPNLANIAAPDEIGTSFEENAILKALYYSRFSGELVLADDSGLEVVALGGAPGVFSARYAGPNATDADNNSKLLDALRGTANRAGQFVCVVALARQGRTVTTARAIVEGRILTEPRGSEGFGYDPLFFYTPLQRSFGEMIDAEKLAVSARGQALRQAFAQLSA